MKKLPLNHVYVHHKGGKYLLLAIAEESTNSRVGKKVAVYISLTFGKVKCRDLDEFIEVVEWPDGERRARFIPVETNSK